MDIVNEHDVEALMFWADHDHVAGVFGVANMKAPVGEEDCTDCMAVVTADDEGRQVFRTAYKPNEIELAHLARGGTLWLSCWHGVPVHMLEVQPPAEQETA